MTDLKLKWVLTGENWEHRTKILGIEIKLYHLREHEWEVCVGNSREIVESPNLIGACRVVESRIIHAIKTGSL